MSCICVRVVQERPLYSNHEVGFFVDKIGGKMHAYFGQKWGGGFW